MCVCVCVCVCKMYCPVLVHVIYLQNADYRTGYSLIIMAYKNVKYGISTWVVLKGKKIKISSRLKYKYYFSIFSKNSKVSYKYTSVRVCSIQIIAIKLELGLFFFVGRRGEGGCPGGSDSEESDCNAGDSGSIPGLIPWRRECQPTPVFLPGEFHGQRRLVGCSPWGCKESDMSE